MDATVRLSGEGEQIGGPIAVTIKATGEETSDSFYLGEAVPDRVSGPAHVHEHLHDMFYVLDGTLTMLLDGETIPLPAGSLSACRPAIVHTFSNPSEAPVRFLNFITPAGSENYMRDLGAALPQWTTRGSARTGAQARVSALPLR